MENHPIQGLMQTAMESIKEMVEVNTIVGNPVETPDGSVIIPISKVGFGFCAGGSEFNNKNSATQGDLPFGGGSGAGVSVQPVAFLVVTKDQIRLMNVDDYQILDKIAELTPHVIENLKNMMNKAKENQKIEPQGQL